MRRFSWIERKNNMTFSPFSARRFFPSVFPVMLAGLAVPFIVSPILAAKSATHVRAVLISEGNSIERGQPFTIGVRFTMNPGWHIYWKNPGDAGAPTRIKWTLPPGFDAGPIEWPAPQKIVAPAVVSYGYENDALLMTKVQPSATLIAGDTVTIKADVNWL